MAKYISAAVMAMILGLPVVAAARSSVHTMTDQTTPPAQGAMHTAENSAMESGSMWEKTKEVTGDVWDGTKKVTKDVWDGTKKVTSDVWDGTKKVGGDVSDAVSGNDGAPTSNPPVAPVQD